VVILSCLRDGSLLCCISCIGYSIQVFWTGGEKVLNWDNDIVSLSVTIIRSEFFVATS
jgi:hypothetical protein